MREAEIQREVEPVVGFCRSLLLGAVGDRAGASLFAGRAAAAPSDACAPLLVPASLATVLAGFLLLTTRRKAIMQVLGYLVLENGIFLFGLLLVEAMPFLVEIGRAARPVRRRVRDGHHHPPHQPRVRLDRHATADGAEGVTDDAARS